MPDTVEYRAAVAADYPEILGLNRLAVPHVNLIDEAGLEALHREAVLVDVAIADGRVVGFMVVLPEGAGYSSPNYRYFADRHEQFRYVDRIVVHEAFRRAGVGAALYRRLFAVTPRGCPVTCEVNLEPPNPVSVAFHERLGFVGVGEQLTEGGAKRVLLMSTVPQPAP